METHSEARFSWQSMAIRVLPISGFSVLLFTVKYIFPSKRTGCASPTDYKQLAEYEIESKDLPARPGEMFSVDENHYGLRTFDADLRILEINANKGAEAIQLLEETGTTSDLQATIPTLYSKKSIKSKQSAGITQHYHV